MSALALTANPHLLGGGVGPESSNSLGAEQQQGYGTRTLSTTSLCSTPIPWLSPWTFRRLN